MQRTVKADATVFVDGAVYEPKDPHSQRLMQRWVGEHVQVRYHNYWGTELEAALKFPVSYVLHMAHLRMRTSTVIPAAPIAENTAKGAK